MARQAGTSFDDAKTNTRSERVKITDLITLFKWPERKWVTVRFYPELHSYATAWVKTITKDKKEIKFPAPLRSYDPTTMEFDSTVYDPWNDLFLAEKDLDQKERCIQVSRKFYGNMIVRKLQANLPEKMPKPTPEEKETGFKDKDSDTPTCWSAFALPPGAIRKIQELKGVNTVESKKTGKTREYSVTDQTYGCDVKVYYDPDKSPAEQYTFNTGERTPLTEEELAMLRWDTANLEPNMPDEKTVRADYEQWAKRNGRKVASASKAARDEDDDDGFEEEKPKRGGKRPAASEDDDMDDDKPKRSNKRRSEDDDDDLDDEKPKRSNKRSADLDDDDELDEKPKRSNKRRASDEDDTEEEEKPKRSGKRKAVENDDDDGFDEPPKRGGKSRAADDEDELDDEPPKRSGKRRAAEPEDDDDGFDEPPKRASSGKKRAVEDDDDLDDDDALGEDDDDVDEPEEKPKRRR